MDAGFGADRERIVHHAPRQRARFCLLPESGDLLTVRDPDHDDTLLLGNTDR